MDSTGENWKIQVPEHTAKLLRQKGYTCVPRGEINVKGKGIMFTYWVLGKNESASRLTSPTICPAGIPRNQSVSSLTRQHSSHSSLAAVVFGMIQVSQQGPSTRKFILIYFANYLVMIEANFSCQIEKEIKLMRVSF
jgi:adenylate cyclase 8